MAPLSVIISVFGLHFGNDYILLEAYIKYLVFFEAPLKPVQI